MFSDGLIMCHTIGVYNVYHSQYKDQYTDQSVICIVIFLSVAQMVPLPFGNMVEDLIYQLLNAVLTLN